MSNSSGVHKMRYERLQTVGKKAVEQVLLRSISKEQIETCYLGIAQSPIGLKSLETGLAQLLKYLYEETIAEFDQIYEENDLRNKLNELDEITQLAEQRREANSAATSNTNTTSSTNTNAKGSVKTDSVLQPVHLDKLAPSEIIDSVVVTNKEDILNGLETIYDKLATDNDTLAETLSRLRDNASLINYEIQEILVPIQNQANLIKAEPVDIDKIIRISESMQNEMNTTK